MATLMPIARAHGLQRVAAGRIGDRAAGVRDAGLALERLNGSFGSLSWISYQVLGVLCLVGAAGAALTGLLPITAGEVVLQSTCFTIFTGSIIGLLPLVPIVARRLESVKSICEVLREPDIEENHGRVALERLTGDLHLASVSFEHPDGGDRPALSNISLHLAAGETVAFVGPSGSGKSTPLNMVLGFLRPTAGRIRFDGRAMGDLDLRALRSFVSVVPQESVLFEGSADRIVVLEHVGIVEIGTHDERIERGGRYATLVKAQGI